MNNKTIIEFGFRNFVKNYGDLEGCYLPLPITPSSISPPVGSKGGAVVRALASHQCGLGSNPGVDAICGSNLLLVLSLALRGFSLWVLRFPLSSKTNISKFPIQPGIR